MPGGEVGEFRGVSGGVGGKEGVVVGEGVVSGFSVSSQALALEVADEEDVSVEVGDDG